MWDKFLRIGRTIPTEKRAYEKWHKGRRDYAVWTIGIENQSVQSRFDAAKTHLAAFLLKPYQRQAHVTLFVCGFLAAVKRFNDDYAVEESKCHLQTLREAKPIPFEIEVGGINSFATAPFLEVFDVSGGLKRTREVLLGTRSEISRGEYIPHITLGLYSGAFETKMVVDKMSSFGLGSPLAYVVNEICLTTYSAQMIAGPLSVRHVVRL